METCREDGIGQDFLCFYLTYEEWKHPIRKPLIVPHPGFYLTYEEWKRLAMSTDVSLRSRFYLTYEEWKLSTQQIVDLDLTVFILPMRNGNFMSFCCEALSEFRFYLTYEEWKPSHEFVDQDGNEYVFILPMRNGN